MGWIRLKPVSLRIETTGAQGLRDVAPNTLDRDPRRPSRKGFSPALVGGLVPFPGLAVCAFLLSRGGGDVLASGSWLSGVMWGLGAFSMLGVLFWLSRLSSPSWALLIIALVYATLLVGSQAAYFEKAKDRLYQSVQAEPAVGTGGPGSSTGDSPRRSPCHGRPARR